MAEPAQKPDDDRGADGRFVPGNRSGRGSPHLRQFSGYRQAVRDAIDPKYAAAVVKRLVRDALANDNEAARIVLPYLLGKPGRNPLNERLAIDRMRALPLFTTGWRRRRRTRRSRRRR